MSELSIVYFKNSSIKEEIEIEEFWLNIKKEIYEVEEDNSTIRTYNRRMHQSAYVGEYAGIFIEIIIAGLPILDATLSIWEKIVNHLKTKREAEKVVRINNLSTLENLCKFDLIFNKGIKNADIYNSKILTENYEKEENLEAEFIYEGNVKIENAAEIVFENKNEKFIYVIQTDGNIVEYKRENK